jgi:phage tail sheath gpL-like
MAQYSTRPVAQSLHDAPRSPFKPLIDSAFTAVLAKNLAADPTKCYSHYNLLLGRVHPSHVVQAWNPQRHSERYCSRRLPLGHSPHG